MGLAGRILHDVDLTDAQKRQIHDMVRSHVEGDLQSLIRDFGEARHALEMLVWDPAASDKDIAAASDVLARSSLALERGRRRLATDILGALTTSQRQKFHEMLASAKPPMPPPPPPGPPEDEPDSER
jgi:Spy/CpxP family protein refolding chaperone